MKKKIRGTRKREKVYVLHSRNKGLPPYRKETSLASRQVTLCKDERLGPMLGGGV